MNAIRTAAEDTRHDSGKGKETQIIWRKIVSTKPNPQTAKRNTLHFQELVIYIKEKEKSCK